MLDRCYCLYNINELVEGCNYCLGWRMDLLKPSVSQYSFCLIEYNWKPLLEILWVTNEMGSQKLFVTMILTQVDESWFAIAEVHSIRDGEGANIELVSMCWSWIQFVGSTMSQQIKLVEFNMVTWILSYFYSWHILLVIEAQLRIIDIPFFISLSLT